jgi:hypothetical protein
MCARCSIPPAQLQGPWPASRGTGTYTCAAEGLQPKHSSLLRQVPAPAHLIPCVSCYHHACFCPRGHSTMQAPAPKHVNAVEFHNTTAHALTVNVVTNNHRDKVIPGGCMMAGWRTGIARGHGWSRRPGAWAFHASRSLKGAPSAAGSAAPGGGAALRWPHCARTQVEDVHTVEVAAGSTHLFPEHTLEMGTWQVRRAPPAGWVGNVSTHAAVLGKEPRGAPRKQGRA